jgi:hypothetical protein
MMSTRKSLLLDFIGSLGAILAAMVGMYYFGQIASEVGRTFLYILGFAIIALSLPGIASLRLLLTASNKLVPEHPQPTQSMPIEHKELLE